MTNTNTLAPITSADRIQALDAITGADRWADTAIYLLVQGKFFPLFSMLFGMGFAIMLMRAQAAGRPFVAVYLRRVLALLVFGLLHALLVWPGDILVTYALMGLLLLLFFRGTPQSRLPKWGIALMLVPAALTMALGLLGSAIQALPGDASAGMAAQAWPPGSGRWRTPAGRPARWRLSRRMLSRSTP